MLKTTLAAAIVAAGAIGLAGCDVKKTQEGKYDVTSPDVKVGKTEKQVTVPKVETEKKTIEVPTIGVKTAKEKEQEQAAKQMGGASASR
jgi:hypothetical protein